jgi:hypothetical protein
MSADIEASAPITQATLYINNQIVKQEVGRFGPRYTIQWNVSAQNLQSQNTLRLEVVDEKGQRGEMSEIVYK